MISRREHDKFRETLSSGTSPISMKPYARLSGAKTVRFYSVGNHRKERFVNAIPEARFNWIGTPAWTNVNVTVRQGSRAAEERSLCSTTDHNKASDHELRSAWLTVEVEETTAEEVHQPRVQGQQRNLSCKSALILEKFVSIIATIPCQRGSEELWYFSSDSEIKYFYYRRRSLAISRGKSDSIFLGRRKIISRSFFSRVQREGKEQQAASLLAKEQSRGRSRDEISDAPAFQFATDDRAAEVRER